LIRIDVQLDLKIRCRGDAPKLIKKSAIPALPETLKKALDDSTISESSSMTYSVTSAITRVVETMAKPARLSVF